MSAGLPALRVGVKLTAVAGLSILSSSCAAPQNGTHHAGIHPSAMSTREVVLAFEKMAFDERRPTEAMEKHASADFIDHHPNIRGDRASAIEHLERLDWSTGGPQRRIVHLVVEGEIAIIHHHLVRKPGDAGIAAVDIFRVSNGKLVEHWDVLQPVPENSVNPHPMF